ncbi:MAG: hypothetical protein DWQ31_21530 [Planctomycetota bacterium]|nr:MAG: hypothetical protein DWQ31_21530 [Planctomycetota bacterium]REJ93686.1 MAG: hypothetical protein DWQ35_10065 [Planctomycetota bacterium]REK25735.1 MAG: hypothetical protein DWQ42_10805 [Planctomycetota bacterium]REK46519.1 MAG: hypothetical protein DWQ46_06500 [Planctomycetota bacterium]
MNEEQTTAEEQRLEDSLRRASDQTRPEFSRELHERIMASVRDEVRVAEGRVIAEPARTSMRLMVGRLLVAAASIVVVLFGISRLAPDGPAGDFVDAGGVTVDSGETAITQLDGAAAIDTFWQAAEQILVSASGEGLDRVADEVAVADPSAGNNWDDLTHDVAMLADAFFEPFGGDPILETEVEVQ